MLLKNNKYVAEMPKVTVGRPSTVVDCAPFKHLGRLK